MKSSLNIADIHFAFSTALDDIIANDRKRKSVILFPNTSAKRYNRFTVVPKNWAAIYGLMQEAFSNDIPVVVPAGNGALSSAPRAIDTVPALWGISSSASGVRRPFSPWLYKFPCVLTHVSRVACFPGMSNGYFATSLNESTLTL